MEGTDHQIHTVSAKRYSTEPGCASSSRLKIQCSSRLGQVLVCLCFVCYINAEKWVHVHTINGASFQHLNPSGKPPKCTIPNSAVQSRLSPWGSSFANSRSTNQSVRDNWSVTERRLANVLWMTLYCSTNHICLKEHCIFKSAKSILYIWKCWSFKLSVQLQVLLCVFMSNIWRHLWRRGGEGGKIKKKYKTSTKLVTGRSLRTIKDLFGCCYTCVERQDEILLRKKLDVPVVDSLRFWKCGEKCCFMCNILYTPFSSGFLLFFDGF